MTYNEYSEISKGFDREAGYKAHRAFYGQFVTQGLMLQVVSIIGEDVLLASTERFFNDIPLERWHKIAGLASHIDTRGAGHSLSVHVCILKEAARRWHDIRSAKELYNDMVENGVEKDEAAKIAEHFKAKMEGLCH